MESKAPVMALLVSLFLRAVPVFSQDLPLPEPSHEAPLTVNEGAYYVLRSETGEQRIIQRLSWPRDENAYRYEVIIERQEGEKDFVMVHREFTGESFLEVSLGPGNYRYRVEIYNLLNQHEYTTNWASFVIAQAMQPLIWSFAPAGFFLDDDFVLEIELQGEDFVEGAVVYLEPLDGSGEAIPAMNHELHNSGRRIRAAFNREALSRGDYRIVIKNPGGLLDDTPETFKIKLSRIYPSLSLDYTPLLPLHGYLFDLFDAPSFAGGTIRSDVELHKIEWGIIGIEGSLSYNYLSTRKNDMDITAHIGTLEANFFFRKQFFPMVFTIYGGTGLGGVFLLKFDYGIGKSDPYNVLAPILNLGGTFQWYFTKDLYAELGIKYIFFFTKDSPRPGYVRPALGLGWRF
ncbi:MAG: hypothetical protein LBO65_11010 [Spirochaetaceae bacterium]|jgi:hypothetical protein|nr:hypothetical protein [Spirochaetaceae bacterium]